MNTTLSKPITYILDSTVMDLVIYYCADPKTVNTRIISGMLLCCREKANQVQDEKKQAVTVIGFVACSFLSFI